MNTVERIKYYLGDELYNTQDKKILNNNCITYNDLIFQQNNNAYNLYHLPLKNLLEKCNIKDKRFLFKSGDVAHDINDFVFVKNRGNSQEKKTIILRCLNFDRHWSKYYNKPEDILFEEKINKIIWRGTTTGNEKNNNSRFTLVKEWFNKNDNIDIGFSFICQNKELYKDYVKNTMNIPDLLKYKYIISVEGNDKDSGLNWKLNSNSLILMTKPTKFSWLMEDKLIPNFHYILLEDGFADLKEKLDWCNNNQHLCKLVIKNANDFMKQFKNKNMEEEIEKKVVELYFEKTI